MTSIAGYSMGGYGTYKLATQFPDLFAKGQPTVGPPGLGVWAPPNPPQPGGDRSLTYRQLASLRHIPFLIWNASGDQLVPLPGPQQQAQGFDDLGYRYEFDVFSPAEHLTLAIHDQYAPAAQFLGDAAVERDPAHVSYVRNPTMDFPAAGTTADHAYWLSAIALREGGGEAPLGTLDAVSGGIPEGDAPAGETQRGGGSLGGRQPRDARVHLAGPGVGATPPSKPRTDALSLKVRNVGTVTVHPERARITCGAALTVDTDGPVRVVFAGCGRSEAFSGAGTFRRAGAACASTAGFRRATVRPRGRGLRVAFSRALRRKVTVDVLRHSRGRRVLGARRVKRFAGRARSFTWDGRGRRAGRGLLHGAAAHAPPRRRRGRAARRARARAAGASPCARRPCAAPRAGCSRASCSARPVFGGTTPAQAVRALRAGAHRPGPRRRAPRAAGSSARSRGCGASAPGGCAALSLRPRVAAARQVPHPARRSAAPAPARIRRARHAPPLT